MFVRICDLITRLTEYALAIGFFALIATLSVQVIGRTAFSLPTIWTLDVAQFLFAWLIFVGAAVALRRHAHYVVDVLPEHWHGVTRFLTGLSLAAAAIVIYILIIPGWNLATLRSSAVIPSLNISMFWIFLALPVSGALMALYTIEHVFEFVRKPDVPQISEEPETE